MYTDNDFRLYHHGILGQKWGIQHGPPYPLDSEISTGQRLKEAAGRAAGAIKKRAKQYAEASAARRAENKIKREERAEQRRQDRLEKIVREGDIDKVGKVKDQFTDEQLRRAITRVNLNEQLKDAAPKTHFDRSMERVERTRLGVERGISAWNTFAKVVNSFTEEQTLPVLNGTWAGDRAADRLKEEREAKKFRDEERQRKLNNLDKQEQILWNREQRENTRAGWRETEEQKAKRKEEEEFTRNSTPDDFRRNASNLSTDALKDRAQRENYMKTVLDAEDEYYKKGSDAYWDSVRNNPFNTARLLEDKGKKAYETALLDVNDDDRKKS